MELGGRSDVVLSLSQFTIPVYKFSCGFHFIVLINLSLSVDIHIYSINLSCASVFKYTRRYEIFCSTSCVFIPQFTADAKPRQELVKKPLPVLICPLHMAGDKVSQGKNVLCNPWGRRNVPGQRQVEASVCGSLVVTSFTHQNSHFVESVICVHICSLKCGESGVCVRVWAISAGQISRLRGSMK